MIFRSEWFRIVGGGCFLNIAATGLLVALTVSSTVFQVNSIVIPFLAGATLSFGLSLLLVRRSTEASSAIRNVLLAGVGVVLGSVGAVLGITAYLFLTGI